MSRLGMIAEAVKAFLSPIFPEEMLLQEAGANTFLYF
jgi:hypothetical protein